MRTARWRNLAFAAAHVADSLARSAFGFASVRSARWLSHLSGYAPGLREFLGNSWRIPEPVPLDQCLA